MVRNNKLYNKNIMPYVSDPARKEGPIISYPAIVIDTGNEYVVSELNYNTNNRKSLSCPFSF